MERSSNYRLLKIREILFNETDEYHEMGIGELSEKIRIIAGDVTFDNRTIKRDLEALDDMDFEIVQNKGKFGKILFSHQTRLFETYQLRLIIDAILSARFITTNEKEKLIQKVKELTSKHIAKTLPEPILFDQSANIDYELVKINIDCVHRAISEDKVLTYQYGKFNVKKEFEYHRNGDFYHVEPYALIWQNDYYYLIGRFQDTNELRHYRLDRIRHIEVSEKHFTKCEFNLQEYVNQSFHMFAGEEMWMKIRFHNSMVNVVLDRFGQEADIKEMDEGHFMLTTKVKLSDGLINWILTWGNKAKVLSPDHLVERMKDKIIQMSEVYKD
ncbi:Predicted DNA-binding transcriptional regulator YafY, contains an HTH and WYL domains [Virgibacillus subterraneus]|uniref:Predicted DNA-binding transcriptional regulator YafY, contains an HTH and WYL domains n=1 Tax=Virgibacillus subterraneus TaxID=621109 RepID=A0A1H9A0G8_9BACI|nr:WYL domain-containing protein [Virgibacillus subterraneus]SEP70170.1 Predicted DNA-binding transcriptional regulator YafY, contains an HTH and WYL domains [Virgibacillus subterraneus]